MQYQAIPFFPQIINYGDRYQAHGQSDLDAKRLSLSRISQDRLSVDTGSIIFDHLSNVPGSVVLQPRLIMYGAEESLVDPYVIGWGTSKRKAEENAAEKLLTSRRYCFY
ncbi:hypothetical protein RhiTH_006656 [Rhizoctonia solani]